MLSKRSRLEKGFTLIELMIVLFIVGVLAAVAIPLMVGRTDSAKWSEGKAIADSLRAAARAYIAEKGDGFTFAGTSIAQLGFATGDLSGKYFQDGDYKIIFTDVGGGAPPNYLITVSSSKTGEAPQSPSSITLDQDGKLTEIP